MTRETHLDAFADAIVDRANWIRDHKDEVQMTELAKALIMICHGHDKATVYAAVAALITHETQDVDRFQVDMSAISATASHVAKKMRAAK